MSLIALGVGILGPFLLSKLKDRVLNWCVKKGKEKFKVKFLNWTKEKLANFLETHDSTTIEKIYNRIISSLKDLDVENKDILIQEFKLAFLDVQSDLQNLKSNVGDIKTLVKISIDNLNSAFEKYDIDIDTKLSSLENQLITTINEQTDVILKNITQILNSGIIQISIELGTIDKKVDNIQDTIEYSQKITYEHFAILVEKITRLDSSIEIIISTQEEQSTKVQHDYKQLYTTRQEFTGNWSNIDNDLSEKLRNKMVENILSSSFHRKIINDIVINALKVVPRHIFANLDFIIEDPDSISIMDPQILDHLYKHKKPLRISDLSNSSSPEVIAIMMSLFNIRPSDNILFIGAKGGYIQSLAAEIVGSTGKICIFTKDFEALQRNEYICNVKTPYGSIMTWIYGEYFDDITRLLIHAPFDSIFICGQISRVPHKFLALLKENNSYVIAPIGKKKFQEFTIIEKNGEKYQKNVISDFGLVFGPPA